MIESDEEACEDNQPDSPLPRTAGKRQIKSPFNSQEISHFLSTGHEDFFHDKHCAYMEIIERLQDQIRAKDSALDSAERRLRQEKEHTDAQRQELLKVSSLSFII